MEFSYRDMFAAETIQRYGFVKHCNIHILGYFTKDNRQKGTRLYFDYIT